MKIDSSSIISDIQNYNSDLVKDISDNQLADYVNRAIIYVTTLNPSKELAPMLVRLWVCHLIDNATNDYVINRKMNTLSETYADTTNLDDEYLDEFKNICSQYGLDTNSNTLEGF